MLKLIRNLMLVCSVGCLSGCVAAVAPAIFVASAAVSGFLVYKTVQIGTGGSLEGGFESELPVGTARDAAKSYRRIAVWPSDKDMYRFAQALEDKWQHAVVTPAAVAKAMKDREDDLPLDNLIERERTELFTSACKRTKVDAIYFMLASDQSQEMNFWSFERAKSNIDFEHGLYDCKSSTFSLREKGRMTLKLGSSNASYAEVQQAVADIASDRCLEFITT